MISIGDRVRKVGRRNHRGSTALGRVTELFVKDGKEVARNASGSLTTVWPIKKLKVVFETQPCECGGNITLSNGECSDCLSPRIFGA